MRLDMTRRLDGPGYSVFKLFTGLALAARIVCARISRTTIPLRQVIARAKGQAVISIRLA